MRPEAHARGARGRRRRVPVVLQLNRVECGAACLAMILGYHGRRTSVRSCRDHCGGGRAGVSAGTIARAARSYGLDARGLEVDAAGVAELPLPVIAHWEGDHFVVVERAGPRGAVVVDPAWGRRRLTPEEFAASFSGTVLVLAPGDDFPGDQAHEPPAWRLMAASALRLGGMRALLGQVLLATVVLQLLGLAMPVATKVLVDDLLVRGEAGVQWLLGAGLGVALLAALCTRFLRSSLLLRLQGRLDWEVLSEFAGRLFRLPLGYFQQRAVGDIVTRMSSVAGLRDMLTNQVLAATLDAGLVVVYVAAMLVFAPLLGLVVLAILAVQGFVLLTTRGRARDLMAREVVAQVAVNDFLVQTLGGVATIKASGAQGQVIAELQRRIGTWTRRTLRRGHLSNWVDAIEAALRMLAPILVLWLGILRVMDGSASPGTVLAMTWLASAVVSALSSVVTSTLELQMAGLQVERVGDVMLAEPERGGSRPVPRAGSRGAELELVDVTFRYEADGPPAVRDVSAHIPPGRRVAIVGHSGAGKTTLAWLLLGLMDPTGGEVRYEGVPLPELDPADLRRSFGVVLQDTFVMGATIEENIAFARPEATHDDVVRAGKLAEIHEEVRRLPAGYRTRLAERGAGLSGGQLQRLAIARALVGGPGLLVLDEATSHLDAETESRVLANIGRVACTQVVIAHRLSTVQNADLILVMREGALAESGTHPELLARQGVYAALVRAQVGGQHDATTWDRAPTDGRRPEPERG